MNPNNCKCPHHTVQKVVMFLALVSVVGFWVATVIQGRVLGISMNHFLKEFVVFSLILLVMRHACSCCNDGMVCTNWNKDQKMQ